MRWYPATASRDESEDGCPRSNGNWQCSQLRARAAAGTAGTEALHMCASACGRHAASARSAAHASAYARKTAHGQASTGGGARASSKCSLTARRSAATAAASVALFAVSVSDMGVHTSGKSASCFDNSRSKRMRYFSPPPMVVRGNGDAATATGKSRHSTASRWHGRRRGARWPCANRAATARGAAFHRAPSSGMARWGRLTSVLAKTTSSGGQRGSAQCRRACAETGTPRMDPPRSWSTRSMARRERRLRPPLPTP